MCTGIDAGGAQPVANPGLTRTPGRAWMFDGNETPLSCFTPSEGM